MTHYDPNDFEEEDDKQFWSARLKIVILIIAFWILFIWIVSEALAGDRIRLYDSDKGIQEYTGYAEKQSNGEWRFYDKHGLYEGRMTKDRFFNEKGNVLQKYYLFNK